MTTEWQSLKKVFLQRACCPVSVCVCVSLCFDAITLAVYAAVRGSEDGRNDRNERKMKYCK